MLEASSIDGCLLVWRLPAGVPVKPIDLGNTKGWSLQVDGDLAGGTLTVMASNNGVNFYPVDTIVTPGLYTPDDDYRFYAIAFESDDQYTYVTVTIYCY